MQSESIELDSGWMNQSPIFYNKRTRKASQRFLDLLDNTSEIDTEGLKIYLDFGHCAFGKTLINNIEVLKPSKVFIDSTNKKLINLEYYSLNVDSDIEVSPEGIVKEIELEIINSHDSRRELIIPLSGGLDSRFLAGLSKRIGLKPSSYTYKKSLSNCQEINVAEHVSQTLGIPWQEVDITDEANYLRQCFDMFGPAMHAHCGHAFSFYSNINKLHLEGNVEILSGYLGDLFAGKTLQYYIDSPSKLYKTYRLLSGPYRLDSSFAKCNNELCDVVEFYESNAEIWKDKKSTLLELYRQKSNLLTYLIKVPESFNMAVSCPLAKQTIACAMLNLSEEERKNRAWQRKILSEMGLTYQTHGKTGAMYRQVSFMSNFTAPLNEELLKDYICLKTIKRINAFVDFKNRFVNKRKYNTGLLFIPSLIAEAKNSNSVIIRRLARRYGKDIILKTYIYYMILFPLQELLYAIRDKAGVEG